MLRSHIDVVTSSGFVDGWAYDTASPAQPVSVRVLADGEDVGCGLANRYRPDLMEAGIGTGWCAFRVRATCAIGQLRRATLSLAELSGKPMLVAGIPLLVEDTDMPLAVLDDITRSDPTQISSIDQLRGCSEIFTALIGSAGIDAFIRAAYIYLLGRPVDPTGLKLYSALIATSELTPFGLLQALCDSEEFTAVPRILVAPTEPGFIFTAL